MCVDWFSLKRSDQAEQSRERGVNSQEEKNAGNPPACRESREKTLVVEVAPNWIWSTPRIPLLMGNSLPQQPLHCWF